MRQYVKKYVNKRVYIGPPGNERADWIEVRCKIATKPTTINGALAHCLTSRAGYTVGCTVSNMAVDPKNASAFPEKPIMASITKTTAIIITKLRGAGRANGIIYSHQLGSLVDANDDRSIKKAASLNPGLMDRSFELLPYRIRPSVARGTSGVPAKRNPSKPNSYMPRGTLRRAVKAGIISREVARQWRQSSRGSA